MLDSGGRLGLAPWSKVNAYLPVSGRAKRHNIVFTTSLAPTQKPTLFLYSVSVSVWGEDLTQDEEVEPKISPESVGSR